MKRHLTLALLAAFALSACTDKPGDAAAPAPDAAPTAAAAPSEAELMAAAEAAANASADPSTAAAATDPAVPAQTEAAPVVAANDAIPGLKLGTDYEIIPNGQPFEPLDGKVEVVEVFNFVCPACAAFQPLVVSWEKKLPPGVRFTYVPAAFGPKWDQYVRAFYAAQTLGIEDKSHNEIYNAIHIDNKLKGERGEDSDDEIAAVYAQFGVDAKQFASNMKSFAVTGKFNKAKQYIVSQRVSSTPTLMVNGKYMALGRTAEDRFRIVDALVAHELAQTASP